MKLNIIGILFAAGVALAVPSPAEADQIADQVGKSATGVGLGVASPAQADQAAKNPISLSGSEFDLGWVLPTLLIAGFATGYGVRSLVSSARHRRARRLKFGSLTSDQSRRGSWASIEANNSQLSQLSLVPRDDVGDLQSPQRPTAARPTQSS